MVALHKDERDDDSRALMTVAEYLRLCDQSGMPYEYLHGRAYMMTGSKPYHSRIVQNTVRALEDALGVDGPCYVYGPDARVQVAEDVIFLPDVTISCEEIDANTDMLIQPKVVVEVLSPSTENTDRTHKYLHYLECPSIQAIIFVDYRYKSVTMEQQLSGAWDRWPYSSGDTLTISCLNIDIPVDVLYHGVHI